MFCIDNKTTKKIATFTLMVYPFQLIPTYAFNNEPNEIVETTKDIDLSDNNLINDENNENKKDETSNDLKNNLSEDRNNENSDNVLNEKNDAENPAQKEEIINTDITANEDINKTDITVNEDINKTNNKDDFENISADKNIESTEEVLENKDTNQSLLIDTDINLNYSPAEHSITLNWVNPTDDDFKHISIYRNEIKIADITDETYEDTKLFSDKEYTYTIKLVNTDDSIRETTTISCKTKSDGVDFREPNPSNDTSNIFDLDSSTYCQIKYGEKITWLKDITNRELSIQFDGGYQSSTIRFVDENNEVLEFMDLTNGKITYSLASGSRYNVYKVIVPKNAVGIMADSTIKIYNISCTTDSSTPSQVTNLSCKEKEHEVDLTWDNPKDGDFSKFYIYRDGVKAGESTTNTFTDNKLFSDKSYSYVVYTVSAGGNISDKVTIDCKTKSDGVDFREPNLTNNISNMFDLDMLTCSQINYGEKITWLRDITSRELSIQFNGIYQGSTIRFVDENNEILEFMDLTNGKITYSLSSASKYTVYKVIVPKNAVGIMADSSTIKIYNISCTTDSSTPSQVTNLSCKEKEHEVDLTWDNPKDGDFAKFYIYRDGVKAGESITNTFTDNKLFSDESYSYAVYTVSAGGNISDKVTIDCKTKSDGFDLREPNPINNTSNMFDLDMLTYARIDYGKKITWLRDITSRELSIQFNGRYQNSTIKFVDENNEVLEFMDLTNGKITYSLSSASKYTAYKVIVPKNAVGIMADSSEINIYNISYTNNFSIPSQVANLACEEKEHEVTLTWDTPKDGDFAKFYIYRDGVKAGESTTNTFTDKKLFSDESYSYAVYTVNDGGNISDKVTIDCKTKSDGIDFREPNPIDKTSNIFDLDTSTYIKLNYGEKITWLKDITNRELSIQFTTRYNNDTITFVDENNNALEFMDLTSGKITDSLKSTSKYTEHKVIVPKNAIGIMANSSDITIYNISCTTDSSISNQVTNLTCEEKEHEITLTWDNPKNGDFAKFYIYRDDVKAGESTTNTFTDKKLFSDENYSYAVCTVDDGGNISDKVIIDCKTKSDGFDFRETSPIDNITNIFDSDLSTYSILLPKDKITWSKDIANRRLSITFIGYSSRDELEFIDINGDTVEFINLNKDRLTNSISAGSSISTFDVIVPENAVALITRNNYIKIYDISHPDSPSLPSQISNLTCNEKEHEVTLNWTNPTDSDFSKVYIYRDGVKAGETTENTFTVKNLFSDESYTCDVYAVNIDGNISNKVTINVKTKSDGFDFRETSPVDNITNIFDADLSTYDTLLSTQKITWLKDIANRQLSITFNGYSSLDTLEFIDKNGDTVEFMDLTNGRINTAMPSGSSKKTYEVIVPENAVALITRKNYVKIYDISRPDSTSLPSQISNLTCNEKEHEVTLNWTNPTDSDFSKVYIYRDGIKAGETTGNTFTVKNLFSDESYTCNVYAVNTNGNISNKVTINVRTKSDGYDFRETSPVDNITNIFDADLSTYDTLLSTQKITWLKDIANRKLSITFNGYLSTDTLEFVDVNYNTLEFMDLTSGKMTSGIVSGSKKSTHEVIVPENAVALITRKNYAKIYDISIENPETSIKPEITLTKEHDNVLSEGDKIGININANCAGKFFYIELPTKEKIFEENYTYNVSENGIYKFKAYNSAGAFVEKEIEINNFDLIGPKISISKSDENYTNNNVILNITATDLGIGIKNLTLPNGKEVLNKNGEDSIVENYIIETNGVYLIKAEDTFGNISELEVNITNIDKEKPVISSDFDKDKWYRKNDLIKLNASDNIGIKSTILPDGLSFANDSFIKINAKGKYVIDVTDLAGNTSSYELNIEKLDNTKATIDYTLEKSKDSKSVIINLKALDLESGISKIENPNGDILDKAETQFIATKNGFYNFKAYDKAGNVSSIDILITSIKDVTADNDNQNKEDIIKPTLIYSLSTEDKTNSDVYINVIAFDNVKVESITAPNGNVSEGSSVIYKAEHNGDFKFTATDSSGNKENIIISITNIDKEPIEAEVIQSDILDDNTINLELLLKNKQGEISSIESSINEDIDIKNPVVNVDKNGWYQFKITDTASNSTIVTSYVDAIPFTDKDTEAPIISYTLNEDKWTSKDVVINITAIDNNEVEYIVTPSLEKVYSGNVEFAVSANGTYKFEAVDSNGNKSELLVTVSNIDTTKPLSEVSIEEAEDKNIKVTVSSTDYESGIESISLNNKIISNGDKLVAITNISEKVEVLVTDKAGNAETIILNTKDFIDIEYNEENNGNNNGSNGNNSGNSSGNNNNVGNGNNNNVGNGNNNNVGNGNNNSSNNGDNTSNNDNNSLLDKAPDTSGLRFITILSSMISIVVAFIILRRKNK